MGANTAKRYSSYKSQPKVLKLFLNFLSNGSQNNLEIFLNCEFPIVNDFSDNFKITAEAKSLNYLENERS